MRKAVLLSFITFLFIEYAFAVPTRGTDSKKAYKYYGMALREKNLLNYENALKYIDKSIKKDPKYMTALSFKAGLLMELKRFNEAEQVNLRIIQLDQDNLFAIFDLANIYFETDRYKECKDILNRALPLSGVGDDRVKVQKFIDRASFAEKAFANPVPFEPINLGTEINTKYEEYFPGLDIEEKTLYYTRRDGSLPVQAQNEDIYFSKKLNDNNNLWSQGTNLGNPVNTPENEGAFSASADGKYIYFTSCSRPGGVGRCDIWFSTLDGDKWSKPENLGLPVNTKEWESQPSISADGVTLYFVSNRPGGYGGTDIWYAIKQNDSVWSKPINLGPGINTEGDEEFPFIHNDGVTLYFTSKGLPGMGGADIFVTRKMGTTWSKPENLGYPINTHGDEWNFIVNRQGNIAYFASTGLKPNYGGMDIYSVELYEGARPKKTGYVHGTVFDIETKKKLKANVELYNLKTGEKVTETFSDAKTGSFFVNLPANSYYAFEARAEGYLFHSENFSLANESSLDKPFELEIGLKPIKNDQTIVMKNVLFDTDKSDLKSESFVELDILVDFLAKNPNIKVEIGGHTDNTGSESHNKTLSENRAKSVYNYLISKGISSNRLSFKGYGSAVPITGNETPEGRATNRRTEMKIVTF
ncbi:MAG: PD40 domain-containing protein [Flavobacteriales bacterium]|nr:PD40 domain-containing protein [Flavobacteriales bacterium]